MTEQRLTRTCSKCRRELPLTSEFFQKAKDCVAGLRSTCRDCRVAQQRERYKQNPDQARTYSRQYSQANAAKCREMERRWQKSHPEEMKAKRRRYYERHKDEVLNQSKGWRDEHRDKIREINHAHRARNYGIDSRLLEADFQRIYRLQKGQCLYCGKELGNDYHTDHFIPLCKGGTNGPENIALVCQHCNQQKQSRLPQDWPEWNGVYPVEWQASA